MWSSSQVFIVCSCRLFAAGYWMLEPSSLLTSCVRLWAACRLCSPVALSSRWRKITWAGGTSLLFVSAARKSSWCLRCASCCSYSCALRVSWSRLFPFCCSSMSASSALARQRLSFTITCWRSWTSHWSFVCAVCEEISAFACLEMSVECECLGFWRFQSWSGRLPARRLASLQPTSEKSGTGSGTTQESFSR